MTYHIVWQAAAVLAAYFVVACLLLRVLGFNACPFAKDRNKNKGRVGPINNPTAPQAGPEPVLHEISPACRARTVGSIGEFSDCLMDKNHACSHALNFGGGRLCFHPRHREIVAQTRPPTDV